MTNPKRRARRTSRDNDSTRARIAIHLQRAVVDLKAAQRELEKLDYHDGDTDHIKKVCRNLAVIHNRYSHIKQS